MNDTIRELILRVVDYVERTPGAHFDIARWDKGIKGLDENQMHFMFFYTKRDNPVYYIPQLRKLLLLRSRLPNLWMYCLRTEL